MGGYAHPPSDEATASGDFWKRCRAKFHARARHGVISWVMRIGMLLTIDVVDIVS